MIYRDDDLIVINKPNRLPLYRGPGGGEVLADSISGLRFDRPDDPAPAHRLDAATSGLLILGRHKWARRRISDLFVSGRVRKTYWAITQGEPASDAGVMQAPLLDVGWPGRPRIRAHSTGKAATTRFTVRQRHAGQSWLELTPLTGRTHQLRVHCQILGCPIVGDPLYGDGDRFGPPMHLHARALTLYDGASQLNFVAPPPAHFAPWLTRAHQSNPTLETSHG
ncbi:putative ribosomal large subunit pseudouridine synthase A [Magnetofaba australis IT-1]|uniref:Putative ribosomal large subunit pseudouridine synthase A n=1 Tax=Magnetofaba australis IT-1 TaxID=1434232 RepID=A0A1Y2K2D1_9PROT|nr:putative ribosomal large subunit pseudouridine synthase A [Magnetofaba australis IT-1]